MVFSALLVTVFTLCGGCETAGVGGEVDTRTGPWWVCPPVKNDALLAHGKPCTNGTECAYGHCAVGSFLVGYDPAIKICVKNNACTGEGSSVTAPCSFDDTTPGEFVSAFERSKSGGNLARTGAEPTKICARSCSSDANCVAWNPETPDCMTSSTDYVSHGTKGVCGKNPFK